MSGYMHIARGNNICSIATYNYYPTVTVTGSTTNAPVTTTTSKPVTATTTSVKPVTTTTTKPVNTTCTNGSGYYLVPNSGCQKYYYCSDSIARYAIANVCGTGNILNQDAQTCVSSTSTCVSTTGICMKGSAWYNYPGCGSVYYCTRTVTQFSTPTGALFNPSTKSFVSSSSSSFKCPF